MQKILITGATSGIGLASAQKFAQESPQNPCHLLLIGRREDRLSKVASKLSSFKNTQISTYCLDIRLRLEVEKFVAEKMVFLQDLDILINNAGLASGRDTFQRANLDDWEVMIDTNIKGLLFMTRLIIPHFIQRNSGHIINIGSIAGHHVYPQGSVYCATKFAVRAITEGLRMDLLGTKIRVTSIDPGMVETEFSLVRFKGDQIAASAVYKGLEPLRASDVANAIHWAATQPPHVNVQEIILMPTDQASIRDISRK